MKFRRMKLEDLEVITKHALYPSDEKTAPDTIDYDFVLEHGEFILAAGGFRMITDSTAWAWIQLTDYVGPHLIPTIRTIREWMDGYYEKDTYVPGFCKEHGICRLQAWVDVAFEEGKRTVEHLGFQKEFKMINFLGKGKDAWMYIKMMEID